MDAVSAGGAVVVVVDTRAGFGGSDGKRWGSAMVQLLGDAVVVESWSPARQTSRPSKLCPRIMATTSDEAITEAPSPAKRARAEDGDGVPLVDLDAAQDGSNTMALTDAARAVLGGSPSGRPLAVITVVGRSRTGKSFLLNRVLLGGRSVFSVDSSVRACTKGLWLTRVPGAEFVRTMTGGDGDDPGYDVIVIDTEGLDALDRDESYDMRVFTLALLISGTFIYNSLGSIDEAAVSTLASVAEVANRLKRRNGNDARAEAMLDLPALLWVVRDFTLHIERLTGERTASAPLSDDDYLEEALKVDEGAPRTAKNQLRRVLHKAFPKRRCQTLVRPVDKESDLKRLQQVPDDDLRSEFRAGMRALRATLGDLLRPKRVGEATLDGPTFLALVEEYVRVINAGGVPQVADTWTQIAKGRCERGVQEACAALDRLLGGGGAIGPADTAAQATLGGGEHSPPTAASLSFPPNLLHPSALYVALVHALRHADAAYHQHVVPSMRSTFDRMLRQQLVLRMTAVLARWRAAIEEYCARNPLPHAPSLDGDDGDGAGGRQAVRAWLAEVERSWSGPPLDVTSLPPCGLSDAIPFELESAARELLAEHAGGFWMARAWHASVRGPVHTLASGGGGSSAASVAALRRLSEELAAATSQRDQLERMVATTNAALEEWRQKALEAAVTITTLEAAVAEANARADDAIRRGTALEEQMAREREQARAHEAASCDRTELEDLRSAHERQLRAMDEQMDAMQDELDAATRALEDARTAQAAQASRSASERQAAEGAWAAERARLESAAQGIARERDTLREGNEALKAALDRALDKGSERAREVQALVESQASQRLEWAEKLREAETRASHYAAQASTMEATRERMEKHVQDLEARARAADDLRVRCAQLETEGMLIRAEAERVRQRLAAHESTVADGMRAIRDVQRALRRFRGSERGSGEGDV